MNCQTKPKRVTTQMKAVNKYILMVMFLLLQKSHLLAIFKTLFEQIMKF